MADILPMFPLNLVAYPGEEVNLHIFESRYKQLIHECEHKNITFCILPYYDGTKIEYATEMKLVEVAKVYEDGKMDIKTIGKGLVRILEFFSNHPGKLYPGAEIERIPWNEETNLKLSEQIVVLLNELYKTMKIGNVPVKNPTEFKTVQNAHKVGFSTEDELHFLSLQNEVDRQKFMLSHLSNFVPMVKEVEILKKRAELNGHFKNLKPRF